VQITPPPHPVDPVTGSWHSSIICLLHLAMYAVYAGNLLLMACEISSADGMHDTVDVC
jgi:hypothetical protein